MVEEWQQRTPPRGKKLMLRQTKTLNSARLRLGDNFIDRSAPLVAQDFVASQTASLILL